MAKYQKYAEYKDSGVEWLGEIPSHWDGVPCRSVVEHIVEKNTNNSSDNYLSLMANIGVIRYEDKGDIGNKKPEDLSKCKIVKKGQLVINSMNYSIGSFGMSSYDGICSPVYIVLQSKINVYLERFALRVFENSSFQKYLAKFGNGILEHRSAINWDDIKDKYIPLPSLKEQKSILLFLDYETAKIDSLIEKQQQLIELLKEKRQAVISHAVTKGLNPNVPMKDSGVEWLGDVPEHWTVTRAKLVSDIFVPQRNKPELNEEEGCAWVTMDDMKNKYIQSVNRYVAKNSVMLAGSKILQKGAVIASCVGNFGVTSINNIDVIINQQLQAFIPRNIKAEYLQNLVSISKNYFELIGTAATLVYVNQEGFQNLPVLLPPHDEQVAICVQIENDENKYDQLIQLGLKQIKILQERRTALISAAVTGKVDVRNWQNPNNNNEAKMEFSA